VSQRCTKPRSPPDGFPGKIRKPTRPPPHVAMYYRFHQRPSVLHRLRGGPPPTNRTADLLRPRPISAIPMKPPAASGTPTSTTPLLQNSDNGRSKLSAPIRASLRHTLTPSYRRIRIYNSTPAASTRRLGYDAATTWGDLGRPVDTNQIPTRRRVFRHAHHAHCSNAHMSPPPQKRRLIQRNYQHSHRPRRLQTILAFFLQRLITHSVRPTPTPRRQPRRHSQKNLVLYTATSRPRIRGKLHYLAGGMPTPPALRRPLTSPAAQKHRLRKERPGPTSSSPSPTPMPTASPSPRRRAANLLVKSCPNCFFPCLPISFNARPP